MNLDNPIYSALMSFNVPFEIQQMVMSHPISFRKETFSEVYYRAVCNQTTDNDTFVFVRNANEAFIETHIRCNTFYDTRCVTRATITNAGDLKHIFAKVLMIRCVTRFHLDENTVVEFNEYSQPRPCSDNGQSSKCVKFYDCCATIAVGSGNEAAQIEGLGANRAASIEVALRFFGIWPRTGCWQPTMQTKEPDFWPTFTMPTQAKAEYRWRYARPCDPRRLCENINVQSITV